MLTEETKQQALDAIFHFDIKEADVAAHDLEFELRKMSEAPDQNQAEIRELYHLFIRLKLLTLPRLSDDETLRLFKTNLILMVNDEEIEIAERVETRQLTVPKSLRYEMVNAPIIEAIHANEETIGQNRIFVPGEPAAVAPTVKNWLLDYDRTYGTQVQKDIVWLDYVSQSRNASTLSAEEKSILRKVLKFYEFLKPEYAEEKL